MMGLAEAACLQPLDRVHLGSALDLAAEAIGRSEPNPRVGCIIGHADGRIFGTGSTQRAGEGHAEAMALREARARGHDIRGATAWVTLEPCAHFGRTPPCSQALVEAGIGRCVVLHADPNPLVAGRGLEDLRRAGVQVDLVDPQDPLALRGLELNIGFFSRFVRGRPWVRAKLACSADGRTALADGRSKWITGEPARNDGHAWRRRATAVLTGIGTVLADDPRLDVRAVATDVQPWRVVLDRQLRMPASAAVMQPAARSVLVTSAAAPAVQAWRDRGATVWNDLPGTTGEEPLGALLEALSSRLGVNELHVEAGATLTGALAHAGLVDEWLIYMAPTLIGPGQVFATLPALAHLTQALQFEWTDASMVGRDLRLLMRRPRLSGAFTSPSPEPRWEYASD